jgi:pyridinium-3,5-biscarboxylic acid mononucleotide sulfurtransferase
MDQPMSTAKLAALRSYLKEYERLAIAFSGGVDSTFLTAVAVDVLGRTNVFAYTAAHEFITAGEITRAKHIARQLQFKHCVFRFSILSDGRVQKNPPERCYLCKKKMYQSFKKAARPRNFLTVCDGTNHDDLFAHRPGNAAAEEAGIIRPLADCAFTKKDIRRLSRRLKLLTWNDAANSCLATRFPYGRKLKEDELDRLARSEEYVQSLGFKVVRLRIVNDGVRIEVPEEDIPKMAGALLRKKIKCYLQRKGYQDVGLDLHGYRSARIDQNTL